MLGAGLLLSSCGSYEATGAYTGSQFGYVLGSAIGGITGGWRGHEVGSLIGTIGGAAIGAAVGSSVEKKEQRRYEERVAARQQNSQRAASARSNNQVYGQGSYDQSGYDQNGYDQSGFDPQMRGDDRITFDNEGNAPANDLGTSQSYGVNSASKFSSGPALMIRNAAIYEDQRDGVLTRGEKCSVIFEIVNNSNEPVFDVIPLVDELTGNKHIHISPNMRVESIAPHKAIRYTATLVADRGLRNGQIEVRVGVAQGNNVIGSQSRQFSVPTSKTIQ